VRFVPPGNSSVTVYVDQTCRTPANILTQNGAPVPGSKLDLGTDGQLPLFQGPDTITVLWAKAGYGTPFSLHPAATVSLPIVTGAKGGNAALTSLLAALAVEGVIVDQTS